MTQEQQDLIWACLSKEVRDEIRKDFKSNPTAYTPEFNEGFDEALKIYFGHHNLTSDKEPEEMLMVERKKVISKYERAKKDKEDVKSDLIKKAYSFGKKSLLKYLFGDKCLPDKETEQLSLCDTCCNQSDICLALPLGGISCDGFQPKKVQPKPKFKVGDKIREISTGLVTTISYGTSTPTRWGLEGVLYTVTESEIEPYTEPETKDNMEEKELNLCELLEVGVSVYSPTFGERIVGNILSDRLCDSAFICYKNGKIWETGECIVYPSRALYEKYPLDAYSAWMEWKESRKPKRWRAKRNEKYWYLDGAMDACNSKEDNMKTDDKRYIRGNYFRTKEEAEQAEEVVKEALKKFHEKNIEK